MDNYDQELEAFPLSIDSIRSDFQAQSNSLFSDIDFDRIAPLDSCQFSEANFSVHFNDNLLETPFPNAQKNEQTKAGILTKKEYQSSPRERCRWQQRTKNTQLTKHRSSARRFYRQDTTIPKVLFTQLKRTLFRRGQPHQPYKLLKQHDAALKFSSLISFEIVLWAIEFQLGHEQAGRIRQDVISNFNKIVQYGTTRYRPFEEKRCQVYELYADRLLRVLKEPDSLTRVSILYANSNKTLRGINRLKRFQDEMKKKVSSSDQKESL